MYRQSPSRNQRSKGIKVKYVLQICLLLAVCFWLIYQVKHSHDKKKEFEESDRKTSLRRETGDEIVKLGRKDIIRPQDDQTTSKIDKRHDELIEDEDITEEDENKPEEDEPEEKNVEEKGNNNNNVEDEQENLDAEADREKDSVEESEKQEVVSGDEHGQTERESVSEENESTHEAREENYKADDASSAVTHDTNQTGGTEKENERTEYSNEHVDDVLEEEDKENNSEENNTGEERKNLEVENGETGIVHRKSNVTTSEMKVHILDVLENGSPPTNIVMEGSDRDLTSNGSSEVKIENHDSQAIASERTNSSILNDASNGFDSNSTGSVESKNAKLVDLPNSSNNNENTESSSSDITDGTYENLESKGTESPEEEIQHDGIDESDTFNSMEEKHARADLDTLPEIQTEGTNSDDDVAAE